MRAQEFQTRPPLKTYRVRLKLQQKGYTQQMDTTVMARNAEMARRVIRAQYLNPNVLVGQPKEVK